METCCPSNQFLANQQALLPCRLCPFMNSHLNAIEHKANCVFTMCMTYFCFVLRPSQPFFFCLASSEFKAGSDLTENTMASHRDTLLMVRWSRLLLPRTSEHHPMEKKKKIGKEWFPTLLFMETNQLLRVF